MRGARAIALLSASTLALARGIPAATYAAAGPAPVAARPSAERLRDGYLLAVAPYRFRFPRDHASHPEYRTEWWYYTGRVAAEERRFGYELTFFRVGLDAAWRRSPSAWAPRDLLLAHLAVTDESRGRFRWSERAQRPALGLAGADTSRYHVWADDWSAALAPDGSTHQLQARTEGIALDLALAPLRPPVVHGKGGISVKAAGEGHATHYYSITRLATRGTLVVDGRSFPVTGVSWMDHEFGTHQLAPGQTGWDWFGLRLDDGRDLMLYRLRLKDGGVEPSSSGTLVERDGSAHSLPLDTWTLEETARWTSPQSGGHYPAGWHLRIPGAALDLAVRPTVPEQELITGGGTGVTYWEGSVIVAGTSRGRPVRGEGYVELTGYAGGPPGD
jgi:predicted secreted hydrolase